MLNDLALFLAVAEAGNMTRVAQRNGLPKTRISRTIRRLEERLGVRLFERSTRHLRLTSEGAQLVEQTRPLVDRLEETLNATASTVEEPRGLLRISAPYEFGLIRLGEVITSLLARYPELEIDLNLSPQVPDPRAEFFDIVFRLQIGGLPNSDQIARRVYELERGLYAAPELLKRCGEPKSLAELAPLPCILHPEEPEWRLHDSTGKLHLFQPLARLRTPNTSVRLQGAIAGIGISMLSSNYCREAVASGRIRRVLAELRPEPAEMYALLPARRLMPAKVRVFLDTLDARINGSRRRTPAPAP